MRVDGNWYMTDTTWGAWQSYGLLGKDIAFKDDETWMGQSAGEAFNIRGAVTVGVDYYITEAFFIGASVDPFAYTYCYSMVQPQAGLGALASDSHNYSAFAAPTIKIGFCF